MSAPVHGPGHGPAGGGQARAGMPAGAVLAVVGAALLLVSALLLHWYRAVYTLRVSGLDLSRLGGDATKTITATAWSASLAGKLVVLLALAALVTALLQLALAATPAGRALAAITLGLGLLALLLVALGLLLVPGLGAPTETFSGLPQSGVKLSYDTSRAFGIYVSLVAAVLLCVGALTSLLGGGRRGAAGAAR